MKCGVCVVLFCCAISGVNLKACGEIHPKFVHQNIPQKQKSLSNREVIKFRSAKSYVDGAITTFEEAKRFIDEISKEILDHGVKLYKMALLNQGEAPEKIKQLALNMLYQKLSPPNYKKTLHRIVTRLFYYIRILKDIDMGSYTKFTLTRFIEMSISLISNLLRLFGNALVGDLSRVFKYNDKKMFITAIFRPILEEYHKQLGDNSRTKTIEIYNK